MPVLLAPILLSMAVHAAVGRPPQAPTQSSADVFGSRPASDDDPTGSYVDEMGGPIKVIRVAGALYLESGPSRFTLRPVSAGEYQAVERDLVIRFSGDRLTVSQSGTVVASARRGAPSEALPTKVADLPRWLDEHVPGLLQRYKVPAAAIGYVERGRVVWTKTFGERRRREAADASTLFNVASLTKPITAEVLLRLASRGRLDLDAPMSARFIDPDLKGNRATDALTIRSALQHRTGLPNWRSQTGNILGFVAEPGSRFRYSGEGYTYAARYAEKVSGQSFEALAAETVFGPLKMRDSHYTVTPDFTRRVAYPHDAQGRELWPVVRLDFSGACCLHTTIGDYSKFLASIMTDKALDQRLRVERFALTPNRKDEMCEADGGMPPEVCPPRIAMGLGWFVFGFAEETVIAHTGVNDGERSAAFFVPSREIGYVILTNGANGAKVIRDVTAAAYDNAGYLRVVSFLAK